MDKVGDAGFGGDGESRRDGDAQARHLRQVGSLATEEGTDLPPSAADVLFRFFDVTEWIDVSHRILPH
ncbi:MAG: hypothetical protein DDT27_01622 [Dehalococcoidia bacterium]|nr:hypothetical protein [Chloroflexota bacterium]